MTPVRTAGPRVERDLGRNPELRAVARQCFRAGSLPGLDAIKTGYVTDTIAGGHSHWSEIMVRHSRRVRETSARDGIMVAVPEPQYDSGERRTWRNMVTREGSRGQEYNAWNGDGGNPLEHEAIRIRPAR